MAFTISEKTAAVFLTVRVDVAVAVGVGGHGGGEMFRLFLKFGNNASRDPQQLAPGPGRNRPR